MARTPKTAKSRAAALQAEESPAKPSNKKTPQPHLIPLGRFILAKIEQGGETKNGFSNRFGFKNATINDLTRGHYETSRYYYERLAGALSQLTGEKITADTLYEQMLDRPEDSKSKPKPESDFAERILTPQTVLWHFRRLGAEGRSQIAPEMLAVLSSDWKQNKTEAKSEIEGLITSIEQTMKAWSVSTIEEFAAKLLEKNFLMSNHPDSQPLQDGLRIILEERKLPALLDPSFNVTMDYLAGSLEEGKFNGDATAMLTAMNASDKEGV